MSNRANRRQLAKDLGVKRGLVKGPEAELAVASDADKGEPHGQLLMGNGVASNFVEYPWRGIDSIRDFAQRLHEFLSDETEAFLEFLSPHDGQIHLLTRVGAFSIVAINQARAKGPVAPHATEGTKIIRVGDIPTRLLQ